VSAACLATFLELDPSLDTLWRDLKKLWTVSLMGGVRGVAGAEGRRFVEEENWKGSGTVVSRVRWEETEEAGEGAAETVLWVGELLATERGLLLTMFMVVWVPMAARRDERSESRRGLH
jgi:hypothetical protein